MSLLDICSSSISLLNRCSNLLLCYCKYENARPYQNKPLHLQDNHAGLELTVEDDIWDTFSHRICESVTLKPAQMLHYNLLS